MRNMARSCCRPASASSGPVIAGQLQMTVKEPLGTVVSIVPFNFPVLLFGWN